MKAKYNKKLKEKLFFRLDFSETVGWGHLKRCISISKALSENFEVYFIISDNDKLALDLIEKMNISVIKIKQSHKYGSEVDYYPIDLKHIILDLSHVENLKTPEKFLRYVEILYQKKINTILIDGAGQEAICSYVLPRLKAIIQPYFSLGDQKKPNSDFWIFGREYVIIEDIYKNSYKEKFNPKVNRILITLGGSDPQNITEQILSDFIYRDTLIKMDEIKIKLVIGPYFDEYYVTRLKNLAQNFARLDIVEKPRNLKKFYEWADLCLGASSTSRYEAMACGVPMIFASIYEHHHTLSEEYSKLGTSRHMGYYKNIKFGQWTDAVMDLKNNTKRYELMIDRIKAELDFVGGADRLAKFLSKFVIKV